MNIFRRFLAATIFLLLAALAGGAAPASAPTPAPTPPRSQLPAPTVEPTLPLLLDLSLEGVEKAHGGLRGRLILDLTAFDTLGDVVIRPILPPGLAFDDPGALPERLADLQRGPARRYVLPLRASGTGRLPIRVEVEFDAGQGRRLRLGQGITLDADPPPAGRLHLGAYEVMAVPIEKVGH